MPFEEHPRVQEYDDGGDDGAGDYNNDGDHYDDCDGDDDAGDGDNDDVPSTEGHHPEGKG